LRELCGGLASGQRPQLDPHRRHLGLLEGWAKKGRVTRRPERQAVAGSARQLADAARLNHGAMAATEVIAGIESR
jgi:hypothetical protein